MSEYSCQMRSHPHSHTGCYCCTPHVSCCHSAHGNVFDLPGRCQSSLSFGDLQSFCNSVRGGYAGSVCSSVNNERAFCVPSPTPASSCHHHPAAGSCFEDDTTNQFEEDIGVEWFDEEAMGFEHPDAKFDFPVPSEPVPPIDQLNIMTLGNTEFFVDNDGYVQVHTYGECYKPFVEAAIGVWFGPSHPLNKSELVHRGRRTAEAAHFVAIIEAIRAAGSCGVTKMQINTEYDNVVKFMIYFIFKWEHNGWMTVNGTPVKNQVLIRELDYYSRFLEIKWNVVRDEEAEGLIEAYNLANEALSRSENTGVSGDTSPGQMDADVAMDHDGSEMSGPAIGRALGRVEASNVVRTFLPCGMNEAERQAARRQRFAPY